MPRVREILETEKESILDRLFASKRLGDVTGTPDGDDVRRLGVIEWLLRKLRTDDE
jgi:hypothetical protein